MTLPLGRREFLGSSIAFGAGLVVGLPAFSDAPAKPVRNPICVFTKYLQSLSYDELADAMAKLGVDGIETPIRKSGSSIKPEQAPEELPKLVEALAKRNLKVTMVTSDILDANTPTARPLLQTAKQLGIPMYRLGFYRYDLNQPVLDQLKNVGAAVKEIAALNKEVGIQGVYQNHAGAELVGATVWDFFNLIQDIPNHQLALAFDLRHATVEAGLSWQTLYNAVRSRIATCYAKDFVWDGRKDGNAPLGKGRVDGKFYKQLLADGFTGPISLHVEYLGDGTVQENLAAIKTDLGVLRSWLAA